MDASPKLVFVFWLGVVVVIMTVFMLGVILVMRQRMLRKEHNHVRASMFWTKVLGAAMRGDDTPAPALPKRDVSGFIDAWNRLHGELREQESTGMARIAHEVGLERQLYGLIDHGGFHSRLMAIIALGYMRSRAHFDRIARFLDDRSPIVSLCAARALMQIDSAQAVSMFVPHIVSRNDWSQGSVADILKEGEPGTVAKELGEVALQANAEVAPRLIRFLAGVNPDQAAPVIRKILADPPDDHLISTCLQVMAHADDLPLVRPLLTHPRWHVRMQAASALGRIGEPSDEYLLMPLLTDEQWWVRYRAAQALTKLPSVGEKEVLRIRHAQTDRFACDILDQVMAEQKIGVQQ